MRKLSYRPTKPDRADRRSGWKPWCLRSDGFAMWDSDITPWCAGKMGPKRDILGELEKAARKKNMIWGISTHRMEHYNFQHLAEGVLNDEFGPRYAGFYGHRSPERT